ncbi:Gfo/Idh/MocA family protein [Humibacter sp. RRB41]|uniref:Gfo/Idh/MocA family protein n=1 Tax=Humibacter sp. RRB41 TaxID=2919946 RepID=UPI001FAAA654|nr:Gfo/Idh/MocA family oxidoreductase [Humibacter sp. RRB41]
MRIGILGAAHIAATSLVAPARNVIDVTIGAVAARDASKAAEYAHRHGIPRSYGSYNELLADESLDAVYIPLPNALHGEYTRRALEAGKHVLCEKPFTANADEARSVKTVADATGLVVMEAFHYRYHPFARRVIDIVRSGELGVVESVSATLCVPMPPSRRNIRWHYMLAGGSMMDLGCYAVHMVRSATGLEPEVIAAKTATVHSDAAVDRYLRTTLHFPDGSSGATTVAMWSSRLLSLRLDVRGTRGHLTASRLLSPQFFARAVVHADAGRRVEHASRRPSYEFQLEAFRDAVAGDDTNLTPPTDSVATMTVIDAAYRAAGLPVRIPYK